MPIVVRNMKEAREAYKKLPFVCHKITLGYSAYGWYEEQGKHTVVVRIATELAEYKNILALSSEEIVGSGVGPVRLFADKGVPDHECYLYRDDGTVGAIWIIDPDGVETTEETIARLTRERDAWKRRAEKHGCDVENGDPDCG